MKRTVQAFIGTFCTLASFIVGIIVYLIKFSADYSRLKAQVEHNSEWDKEERDSNLRKFTELYNSRNATNEAIMELATTIKMLSANINQQFTQLDKKIDELKESR